LRCAVQNYEWGKMGSSSAVAQLCAAGDEAVFSIKENEPYAELWMGTHPKAPSRLRETDESLSDLILRSPTITAPHEHSTLQFLFKVLSVRKALSIHSHPTKEQARLLHERDPINYPDDNHKPEMAIALTDFHLLCGFRLPIEIYHNIKENEALNALISSTNAVEDLLSDDPEVVKESLRKVFTEMMNSPSGKQNSTIEAIINRLSSKKEKNDVEDLMINLNGQFPGGDIGVIAPLFLNYFTLKPGQCTFLGPNEPHAYIFGDCIECMACSDNTIRAGLTPKYKDIATLCSSLTYNMSPPPYFHSENLQPGIRQYAPPVPEFAVHEITGEARELPCVGASSIMIVIDGSASLSSPDQATTAISLQRGDIYFISADHPSMSIEKAENFVAFRAFTPQTLS